MVQLLEGQEASFRYELYERCMGPGQPQDVGECESWVCLFKVDLLNSFCFIVQPNCMPASHKALVTLQNAW